MYENKFCIYIYTFFSQLYSLYKVNTLKILCINPYNCKRLNTYEYAMKYFYFFLYLFMHLLV